MNTQKSGIASATTQHVDTVGSSVILTQFVGSHLRASERDWQTIILRENMDAEIAFYDTQSAAAAGHRRAVVKAMQEQSVWVAYFRFFFVISILLGLIYLIAY